MKLVNKSIQSNNLKSLDIQTSQSTDEQEQITEKEFLNSKDLSKENSSNKKESRSNGNPPTII